MGHGADFFFNLEHNWGLKMLTHLLQVDNVIPPRPLTGHSRMYPAAR